MLSWEYGVRAQGWLSHSSESTENAKIIFLLLASFVSFVVYFLNGYAARYESDLHGHT